MKDVSFNQVYFHDCVRQFLDAISEKYVIASVFTSLDYPNSVVLLMQYISLSLKEYLDACHLSGMVFTSSANPCGFSPYCYVELIVTLDDSKFNS